MKTIDERELQKTAKEKEANPERSKVTEAIAKRWKLNDFVVYLS